MTDISKINDSNIFENQRLVREILESQEIKDIDNPALKRCAEKPFNPEKEGIQAYDRMHHTHNRS